MSTNVRQADVLRVVYDYRRQLLERDAVATGILRLRGERLEARMERRATELVNRIRAAERAGTVVRPSWLHEQGRLGELLQQVRQEVAEYAAGAAPVVREATASAAELGQRAAGASVLTASGAVSPEVVAATLPSGALQGLEAVTGPGSPVGAIFREFGNEAATRLQDELLQGVAQGEHPTRLAARMRSVAEVPKRRAILIARTEALRACRSANIDTWQGMDVVDGWVWIAAADSRTCAACWAMHGTVHPDGEELESHPACRCVPAPHVPGQPPLVTPGAKTLRAMDEADLARIIGKGQARDLKAGRITVPDLVATRTSPVWGVTRTAASRARARANANARRAQRRTPGDVPPPPPPPPPAAARPRLNLEALDAAERELRRGVRGRTDWEVDANLAEYLGNRMTGNAAFEAMARHWDRGYRQREGLPPRAIDPDRDPVAQAEANRRLAGRFIDSWAGTSGDSSAMAVSLQQAARQEFGLKGTASPWDVRDDVAAEWRRDALGTDDLTPLRAFLRAQYDETQLALRAAGITKVQVVRGWKWHGSDGAPEWARGLERPDAVRVPMAPMNSYTSDWETARNFATTWGQGNQAVLTAVEVDASQVLGYAPTGFGTVYESEWVVLGGELDQLVWDPRVTGYARHEVDAAVPPEYRD